MLKKGFIISTLLSVRIDLSNTACILFCIEDFVDAALTNLAFKDEIWRKSTEGPLVPIESAGLQPDLQQ